MFVRKKRHLVRQPFKHKTAFPFGGVLKTYAKLNGVSAVSPKSMTNAGREQTLSVQVLRVDEWSERLQETF